MDFLETLNERVLRDVFGAALLSDARQALAQGRVVQRAFLPPNQLAARWSSQLGAEEMSVRFENENVLMSCGCEAFDLGLPCLHVVAMLLAWVDERVSFQKVAAEESGSSRLEAPAASAASLPEPDETIEAMSKEYLQLLYRLNVSEIREIARRRGVRLGGQRKEAMIEALALELARPEKLAADWLSLSVDAQLLGSLLPFTGPALREDTLQKIAAEAGLTSKAAFNQARDELKRFGILAVDSYGWISYPFSIAFHLPPVPQFLGIQELDPAELRVQPAPQPRAYLEKVFRLAFLLQSSDAYRWRSYEREQAVYQKVRALKGWPADLNDLERLARSGSPAAAIAQGNLRIRPMLTLLEDDSHAKLAAALQMDRFQLDLLLRILVNLDLLKITPGKPVRLMPDALSVLLSSEPLYVLSGLMSEYASMSDWTEFDRLLAGPGAVRMLVNGPHLPSYTDWLATLAGLRRQLLLVMRRLPHDRWVDLNSLVARTGFLSGWNSLTRAVHFSQFSLNNRPIRPDKVGDWVRLFQMVVMNLVSGPLYEQGMVDLAWQGEELAGFRLTSLGSALFSNQPGYQLPAPDTTRPGLRFTADGDLQVDIATLSSPLLHLLSLLGDVQIDRQNEMRFQINLEGAGQVFEQGWSADKLLAALSHAAQQPPPPVLAQKLRQWWQDFGAVQLYPDVALIELGDDYAVNELLASTSLSRYLLYRFNARLLAIRPEGVEPLRDELVKKGYTPRLEA